jgi:hypothetical protein
MNEHRTPERDEDRSAQAASASPSDADMRHLDGNAAAGLLRELFTMDVTAADAACAGCGSFGAIGALLEYGHAMGVVLRCPHCAAAVLRVSRTSHGFWLDLTGARVLRLPDTASDAASVPA